MFSGGNNQRISIDNQQVHNDSVASDVSIPSTNNLEGQNSPFPRDNMQTEMQHHTETILSESKKLEDDLQERDNKIKHHENGVNFLKRQENELDGKIEDMEVAVRIIYTTSKEENDDLANVDSKEETIQNIMKHKDSAAALWCQLTSEARVSDFLIKDVVGVVGTLGKVDDPILSRLFSKYLGLDNMLALVCTTYEGIKSLESYSNDGSRDTQGGQFNAFCIEHLRPYSGELATNDPQRRLNIPKPRLMNGQTPPGFLDFAVNMITIDDVNLYSGYSLRETLFYNLFLKLQVYELREDMLKASSIITNGAISLDGGMIRSPGVFSLGQPREDIDVIFPSINKNLHLPYSYYETENQLKVAKLKKNRVREDIAREQQLLDNVRSLYEAKRREFLHGLAESSSVAAQAARVSSPR